MANKQDFFRTSNHENTKSPKSLTSTITRLSYFIGLIWLLSNIAADGLTLELFESLLTCMSGLPFYIDISMRYKS